MKKKVLGITFFIIVIFVAGWNFSKKETNKMSDLTLENIEAIAGGEAGPDWGNHKLVYKPNPCCESNPMWDCSGVYNECE